MSGTRNARSRLMNATVELLREGGIQAAAPAAVVERAGAGKMSLYRHFEGKDALVAESLRAFMPNQRQGLLGPRDEGTPRERLLGIFDRLATYGDDRVLVACIYLTTRLETGPNHPAADITRAYKQQVAEALTLDLAEMDHPLPDATARVLQMLIDGAVTHAVITGSGQPLREARTAAEALLDQ